MVNSASAAGSVSADLVARTQAARGGDAASALFGHACGDPECAARQTRQHARGGQGAPHRRAGDRSGQSRRPRTMDPRQQARSMRFDWTGSNPHLGHEQATPSDAGRKRFSCGLTGLNLRPLDPQVGRAMKNAGRQRFSVVRWPAMSSALFGIVHSVWSRSGPAPGLDEAATEGLYCGCAPSSSMYLAHTPYIMSHATWIPCKRSSH